MIGSNRRSRGQLKEQHQARRDPLCPEWSFPGLHWFLNFHVYLPASTTLLGPPHGLSSSITCNGDSFRPRETLPGCNSRSNLISSQHQLQLCIAALCSKYFESENSPREKRSVNLRPEKGRPQAPGLGIWTQVCSHPDCPGEEGGICRGRQAHWISASLFGAYDLLSLKFQPPETNSSWPKTKILDGFA